jgi:type II secretory pathway predicted ATPase ExeA
VRCNSGYKCELVENPPGKRSLVDDPGFLASLSDLDRGLDSDEEEVGIAPGVNVRSQPAPVEPLPVQAPPLVERRVHPDRRAPSEADPPALARPSEPRMPPLDPAAFAPLPLPPIVRDPVSRRPLLDLFPPSSQARTAPPGLIADAGTTIGPDIRTGPAKRMAPPPAVLPSPAVPPATLPPATLPRATAPPATARPAPAAAAAPGALIDPQTYETFYGLQEKPFSLAADPKFLYHSAAHDEVAQQLLTAIRQRDGLSLVTGELGMGKTLLCRAVTDQLDRRTLVSVLFGPVSSIDDLLKTVLVDFGVIARDDLTRAPQASTREALTAALHSFLVSLRSLQASAVLVIDEAQHLSSDVLAQLPTMAQAGDEARTLQVILVGQPSLTTLLRHSELRLLNEEVAVRSHLGPLAADEIAGYVMHRLGVAGGNGSRVDFDEGALQRVYEASGGTPRVVNLVCDRALLRGFEASASTITAEMVDLAVDDLDISPGTADTRGFVRAFVTGAALAALVCIGAGAALWVFRDAVARTIVQWQNVPVPPAGPLQRLPVPLKPIPPPTP